MARLAKCPQQHVWSPTADDVAAPGSLTCPVCGEAGATLALGANDPTVGLETLDAKAIPPIAGDVTQSFDANLERARRRAGIGTPTIPGYEIVRELGRGGMGVVYLARHQELKRLVALKMILAGVHADKETLGRFHREAEAVARLQHPGITQIHDVGQHDGRPFLALEYIDGSNLYDQLAGKALLPRAAAALVETIARTAHYAHQRGIVHRDLTPRNILLASSTSSHGVRLSKYDPKSYEPKITDFGLAKELDAEVIHTQSGMVLGTPSYMSPEQAQGKTHEIGPATDVYAIGAILYQALTGRPPFLAATSYDTLKQVIEREPVPPARLQPSVPRDLDTICLKCLSKDPAKRYDSAEALADDLHRFLATEPILARRVPWYERTWKWARRRPTAAALLVVIFLAGTTFVIGNIVYSARIRLALDRVEAEQKRTEAERDRAEHNFQLANEAVQKMLTEVGEEDLASEPRMEEKRKKLLERALEFHKKFLNEKADDPRVRQQTAQAYRSMADVERLLGQYGDARSAYDQAILLLSRLLEDSPQDANYQKQIAICQDWQGEALRMQGQFVQADVAYLKSQPILEQLVAQHSDDSSAREELARTLYNRGILLRQTQRPQEAEHQFQRAVQLLAELVRSMPDDPDLQEHMARVYLNLGTVIPPSTRFDDAKSADDRAIETLSRLSDQFGKPNYRHELGVAHNNLGNLFLRSGRPGDAVAEYEKARDRFSALSDDFPKVPTYRQELANSYNSMGSALAREHRNAEASDSWRAAAGSLKQLVQEHPDTDSYRSDLAMVLANLGLADYGQAKLAAARADFEVSIELIKELLLRRPDDTDNRQLLRGDYQNLAEVLLSAHDHAGAAGAARALPDTTPDDGDGYYLATCFLSRAAAEASRDEKVEATERETASRQYANEANAMLRSALNHGFHDVERIEKDRGGALAALAGLPDFQELVAKLAAQDNSR